MYFNVDLMLYNKVYIPTIRNTRYGSSHVEKAIHSVSLDFNREISCGVPLRDINHTHWL